MLCGRSCGRGVHRPRSDDGSGAIRVAPRDGAGRHLLLALVFTKDIARQRLESSSSAHFWLAQLDAVVGDGLLARSPNDCEVVILSHLDI